ncbi:MAG: hypothetical protein QOJ51_497 [Acidobacteriaceae bacterium]|jgi:hypothetical protein|nr:hypothetical protein [Acidobacteriaceae bacterium]
MDPEFFEMATMPLLDQLYNCAHWLTGDTSEAEDLVQETYAKALKGFKSLRGRHQFTRLDAQYPAQYISHFAQWPEGPEDRLLR